MAWQFVTPVGQANRAQSVHPIERQTGRLGHADSPLRPLRRMRRCEHLIANS